jgi:alpha-tubulin suppressor-like RCC1 family protein
MIPPIKADPPDRGGEPPAAPEHGPMKDCQERRRRLSTRRAAHLASAVTVICGPVALAVAGCEIFFDTAKLESDAGAVAVAPPPASSGPVPSQVVLGGNHSCAVLRDKTVACWGANDHGQLGVSPDAFPVSSRPIPVPNVAGVQLVAAGEYDTCALLSDNSLVCWGWNKGGQLGNGRSEDVATPPSPVEAATTSFKHVALGPVHACAVTTGGDVMCWGNSPSGTALGFSNAEVPVPFPKTVVGLPAPATRVAAGADHSCALLVDGTLACWGDNAFGQLGDGFIGGDGGGEQSRATPRAVLDLSAIVDVVAGGNHTCAASSDAVWCWGHGGNGELGNGAPTGSKTPRPANLFGGISGPGQLAAGDLHTCAINGDGGTLFCWGANESGQLGNGSTAQENAPVHAFVSDAAVQVAAGAAHTCAMLEGSQIECWGAGDAGQLGAPTDAAAVTIPTPVSW